MNRRSPQTGRSRLRYNFGGVNPNGPLVEAGSDGDNGQTGRKLVMDFYGPRVPIGGGALSGKHLTHIDRIARLRGARGCGARGTVRRV